MHTEDPYWEKKPQLIMCLIFNGLQACVALFFRRTPALSVCNASTLNLYMALYWNGCDNFPVLPAILCLLFLLR